MEAVVSFNISLFFFLVDSLVGILVFGILSKSCTDLSSSLSFRNWAYTLSPIGITFSKNWEAFLLCYAPVARFFSNFFLTIPFMLIAKPKPNQTLFDQIWLNFFDQKILKYFNDFQNQNFSVLWLKWTKTTEMKQNQTFSMGHIQIWHHFTLVAKY